MNRLSRCRSGFLAIALIAGACTTASRPAEPTPSSSPDFWASFRITGDEVEGYQNIRDMGSSADAVVLGRLTSLTPSRAVQGDAPEDVVTYVAAGLEVSRVLAGRFGERSVPLEFFISSGELTVGELQRLETALPQGDVVVFLRAKRGDGEAGLYRTVNSLGLWAASERAALDTPLSEEAPTASVLADEVAGIGSVEEMADYVSAQVVEAPGD